MTIMNLQHIYHLVNNFCTQDLSAFYLDYAKDILYCEAPKGKDRLAIQTVLYEIFSKLNEISFANSFSYS